MEESHWRTASIPGFSTPYVDQGTKALLVSDKFWWASFIKDPPHIVRVVKRKRNRESSGTDYDFPAGPTVKRARGLPKGSKTKTDDAFCDYGGTDGNVNESSHHEGEEEPNVIPYQKKFLERQYTCSPRGRPFRVTKMGSLRMGSLPLAKHPSNLLHDLMLNMVSFHAKINRMTQLTVRCKVPRSQDGHYWGRRIL